MKAVRPGNDNAPLSEEELEQLAQRTAEILEQRIAEILFHKTMRRLAKVARVEETVRPKLKDAPKIVPSAAAIERARIRRAKKGVY